MIVIEVSLIFLFVLKFIPPSSVFQAVLYTPTINIAVRVDDARFSLQFSIQPGTEDDLSILLFYHSLAL